jgi:NAD(P)-dependent dehydrogenase (short-subunit alcohol dehydrogenase family)
MSELFDLDGKAVIVTGALGLIGRALVKGLAGAGASVVITDLDHAACVDRASGVPNALGHGADITDRASLEKLRDAVIARFGHIDGLVNNAAIDDRFDPGAAAHESKFENYSVERFRRSIDANVTGTFLACQVLGTPMAVQGHGSIINVASTYGLVAPDQKLYIKPDGTQAFFKGPAYPTGKHAVVGLTKFLAAYWGDRGVRVNTLCPGGVENSQDAWFQENYARRVPLKRMAAPTDYAGAVIFLMSDASGYMTGSNVVVDGGWTAW